MASAYPVLNKCLDAKYFLKIFECSKKVGFEYIASNDKFDSFTAEQEEKLAEALGEIEEELSDFYKKNLSSSIKDKIKNMADSEKKDKKEKKEKKDREKKCAVDNHGDDKITAETRKNIDELKKLREEEDIEVDSYDFSPSISAGGASSSKSGVGSLSSDTKLEKPMININNTESGSAPCPATPKRVVDVERIHQMVMEINKDDMFVVKNSTGMSINVKEIKYDQEKKQIQICVSSPETA